MEDFNELVKKLHAADISIIIDMVFNHTSIEHEWFEKSRHRKAGFEDYYVWKDAKPDGTAPTNWLSKFGQHAWGWDHIREQYYLHMFLGEQANLNLYNDKVQNELKSILHFWQIKGVDGFRLDAVTAYLHDPEFRDNPPASVDVSKQVSGRSFNPYTYQDHQYDMLIKEGADYTKNIRKWVGDDCFLIGEVTVNIDSVEVSKLYSGKDKLNACYTTDLAENCACPKTIVSILNTLNGKDSYGWWLSSHDQPRHNGRLGDGSRNSACFYALLMSLFEGSWLMFQGEELGLSQPELSKEETTDPFDLLYWPDAIGREGGRVPLPWTKNDPNFGFSKGKPWLPMRWKNKDVIETQAADEHSSLHFYRALTRMRREYKFGQLPLTHYSKKSDVLFLEFTFKSKVIKAQFNFSDKPIKFNVSDEASIIIASQHITENKLLAKTGVVYSV